MKKIVCSILICCFLFSCSVITVSAKTSETIVDNPTVNDLEVSIANPIDVTENSEEKEEFEEKEYVEVNIDFDNHYEDNDDVVVQVNFSSLHEYEYTKTYYSSTENILLSDYSPEKCVYSNGITTLDVSFDINKSVINESPILNFKEIEFEKIYVTTNAYVEDSIVDSKLVKLSILPTEYGTFLSEYGDIYAYDNYISYIYSNGFITDGEYKTAIKKATELSEIDGLAEIDSDSISTIDLIAYNEETRHIEFKTVLYPVQTQGKIVSTDANARFTSTEGRIVAPNVIISRSIEALDSGERLRVYGYVIWTDIDGNQHPARNIEVKIMEENLVLDSVIDTVHTDGNGYYTSVVENKLYENGSDIYIRVNTVSENFEIVNSAFDSIFTNGYYFCTPTLIDVTASYPMVYYSGSDEYATAMGSLNIHQALVVGYEYYSIMNNGDVDNVRVVFPVEVDTDDNDQVSHYDSLFECIYILENDYCEWDVILHELGHHVAYELEIDTIFADDHNIRENLSERYGKTAGIAGGWSEGWASYFSIASQTYYNRNIYTIDMLPNVADYGYSHINFENFDDIYTTSFVDYTTENGYTEGNELAVTAVLLNLILDSKIGLSHQQLWNIVKSGKCNSFDAFMEHLYIEVDESIHSSIGKCLEKHNIADTPIFNQSMFKRTESGTFKWKAADVVDDITDDGYDAQRYYNQARLTFYNKNFNIIWQSSDISMTSGTYERTLTATEWSFITSNIDVGEPFYWGVATYQNTEPATGPYYSSINKCYFVDDFEAIELHDFNVGYEYRLSEYGMQLFKFTATETGTYTFYSEGETDVRLTCYTDTSFSGNNITDDDSGLGLNFLHSRRITANSMVYLKVDGYQASCGDYVIAVSKTTTTTINQATEENLSGVVGQWYKFEVTNTGIYTFMALSNEDTYGELFYYPTLDGSFTNSITYDDDSGVGDNFKITYELSAGETIYIRVRGYDESCEGIYALVCYYVLSDFESPQEFYVRGGQYVAFEFTAPFDGEYVFYTEGNVNTYGEVFTQPVYDRTSTASRIAFNSDNGEGYNCAVTCSLTAGQTVYVRMTIPDLSSIRTFSVGVLYIQKIELATVYNDTLTAGHGNWYVFTTVYNGVYEFCTYGGTDTYGYILTFYNGDYESNYLASDDDNGPGYNFSILYDLASGQKVYIYVCGVDEAEAGDYSIVVECLEIM